MINRLNLAKGPGNDVREGYIGDGDVFYRIVDFVMVEYIVEGRRHTGNEVPVRSMQEIRSKDPKVKWLQ